MHGHVWLAANCAGAYYAGWRRIHAHDWPDKPYCNAVPDVVAAARQWETMLGATVKAADIARTWCAYCVCTAPNGKVEL